MASRSTSFPADGSAIVHGGVFSYGTDGNPTWVLFRGRHPGGSGNPHGVTLNAPARPFGSAVSRSDTTAVGTAAITINSCRSLTLAWT